MVTQMGNDIQYKEVFDRNLLDLRIVEEEIVVKSDAIAGKRLSDLNLSEYGCFLNRVVRAQIEMPMDLDIDNPRSCKLQVSKGRLMKLVAEP